MLTPAGPYAEAAHIRALGKLHNGPDVASNVLCLCPSHHVLFDTGAIYIDTGGAARLVETGDELGKIRVVDNHVVGWAQLAYHREHHKS